MASNTLDIVHPSDSDDSDYEYKVQNLAQQVMHFIGNNNMPSPENESLNNYSSDNESVDSENGKNGNGNCVQIPIPNYEQDTEHETDCEMGWEWILYSDPGPSVRPFLGEEMLLMDQEKMNLFTSLKFCLRLKCVTILPTKLTNMQKQGLHKDISKNKYLLFYIILFFNMLCDSTLLFSRFFK